MEDGAARQTVLIVIPGDTFINLDYGPDHLWVICSQPVSVVIADGQDPCLAVLIFNFTTKPKPPDPSCVIDAGDHPFVTRRTYVAYARGQFLPVALIAFMKQKGAYQEHVPCSPALLRCVLEGAERSEQTEPRQRNQAMATLATLPTANAMPTAP